MAHLDVDVVAADRRVWSGEARMVSAPAIEGDVGILPGHTPMLALLRDGVVRVEGLDGHRRAVRVDSGFLSVDVNSVTIVVHSAQETEGGSDESDGR